MADYTVDVAVKVADDELNALEQKINSLKAKKIKLNIDTNSVKNKISTINKQINNLRPKKAIKINVDTSSAKSKIAALRRQINDLNKAANNVDGDKRTTRRSSTQNKSTSSRKTTGSAGDSSTKQLVDNATKDFNRLKAIQRQIKGMRFKLSGMDAGKDAAEISKLEKKLNNAQVAYNNLYRAASKNLSTGQIRALNSEFDSTIPATKQAIDSYKQLGRTLKEINSIKVAAGKLTPSSSIHEYDLLNNRLNTLKQNYKELRASMTGQMSSGQLSKLDNEVRDAEFALSRLKAKMHDALSLKIRTDGFDSDMAKVDAKMKNLRKSTDDINKTYRSLNTLRNQSVAAFNNNDIDRAIAKHKEYEQVLKKLNNQIDTQKRRQSLSADPLKVDKLDYNIEKALKKYTAAGTEFENKLRSIQARLKSCNAMELNGLQNEFDQAVRKADLAGKATMSMKDRLTNQFSRFTSYFTVASLFYEVAQGVRYMFRSVLDLDTAMTELYRVTDLTSEQYAGLYDNMISSAKEYGSTLTDMISSTAAWSRLGYNQKDALGLAEVSAMYQHISDLDYDTAVENLVTGYKGFQTELSKTFGDDTVAAVEYVGDVYNELGNNYAITSGQVGDALTRAASALSLAGNTFTESAAMVTGITEVTQDPEKAGSAMKVLSLRLRGMKGELEEVESGASEGVESVSKMQTQILNMTGGKVNIFDDNGEFKSTYEIMSDIAKIYDDLSDPQQADLLETIAGKNRANDVAALLSNWDRVEKANESGINAAGSAAKEHEAYLDSLQGRIDSLKGTFQAFSATFLGSDFLKGLISGVTGFVDILDGMIDKLGTLPVLLGTISGAMAIFKNNGMFFNPANNASMQFLDKITTRQGARLSELSSAFRSGYSEKNGGISGIIQGIGNGINANRNRITTSDISKLQKYNEALRTGTNAQAAYQKHLAGASIAAKEEATRARGAEVNINKLSEAAKKGGGAMKALSSGLSLVGNIGMTMLATMAISAVIAGISKMITAEKDLAKEIDDVTKSYNNNHKTLIDNRKDFEDNAERYAELSSGVYKNTGMNKSLTPTEYEEYQQIANSIAEQAPSLVKGFDAQGNAILSCAGDVDALNEAYDELIIKENNKLLNGDGEDYKGISEISQDLNNAYRKNRAKAADDNNTRLGRGIERSGASSEFDSMNKIEELLKTDELNADKVGEIVGNNRNIIAKKLKEALDDAGEEVNVEYPSMFGSADDYDNYIAEVCKNHPKIAKSIMDDFSSAFDEEVEPMRTAMQAHMENAFLKGDYENLDDDMQSIASQLINGMDSQFIAELNASGGEDAVTGYVDDILDVIDGLNAADMKTFENGFTLADDFANGKMSYGQYMDSLNEFESFLDKSGFDEEMISQIKVTLNIDEAQEEYDALKKRLVKEGLANGEEVAGKFLDGLSSGELTAATKLLEKDIDFSNIDLSEFRKMIEQQAMLDEALSFKIDFEVESSALETLNTALSEARSGSGLTMESFEGIKSLYSDVAGYDFATLFEETANGINLNTDALSELEETRVNDTLKETEKHIGTLKDEYDRLTKQMENADDATKARLSSEREAIRQQLVDLGAQATILEGMNSAYAKWQRAESSGNDRDMYENTYTGLQNVQKELSRGWADKGTKEFAKFLFGDNWNSAGEDVVGLQEKFATLGNTIDGTSYSLNDFLTADENGDLTSEGIFNFFDAVEQKQAELGKNWITYDENGKMHFDFGQGNDKEIADALGVSEEFVQTMLRGSRDAGFDIQIDGDYTDIENLTNEALAAQDAVNGLEGKQYSIDFNTNDVDDLQSSLNDLKSDTRFWDENGNFKKDAEGAQDALKMAQQLQAKIGVLDDKYTGLTVEDDTFEEPLSKLQDYEAAVNELNLLKLDPETNADRITELNGQLSDTVDYFKDIRDNNKGLAQDLGIDGMTDEELEGAVSNGEITVPTTLDIQMDMNEAMGDIRDWLILASDEATEEQKAQAKINLGLEVETDDEQLKKDSEKAGEEAADTAAESAEKGAENSDKKGNVKTPKKSRNASGLVKDGVVSEGLPSFDPVETSYRVIEYTAELDTSAIEEATPEDVEVMVKYLNEGSETMTDEEMEIVAKYLPDTSEIDSWTPEERESFVHFLVESGLIDGYTVDPKTGKVVYTGDTSGLPNEAPEISGDASYDADTSGLPTTAPDVTGSASYTADTSGLPQTAPDAPGRAPYTADLIGVPPTVDDVDASINYTTNVSGCPPSAPTVYGSIIYTVKTIGSAVANAVSGIGGVDGTAHVNGTAYSIGTAYAGGTTNNSDDESNDVVKDIEENSKKNNKNNVENIKKELRKDKINKNGKAFAQGDWGTKNSGTALMGEVGEELIVRDGKWYTVGSDSAEFVNYKKDDIIFNAEQTKQIFEKGKITHGRRRGKALSSGTAFSRGTAGRKPDYGSSSSSSSSSSGGGGGTGGSSSGGSKGGSGGGDSSSSDDAEEFEETIDWIEKAIDRLERVIDQLDTKVESTYRTWSERNKNLYDEISKIGEEIDMQNKAYDRYIKEADSVGLDSAYVEKVQNGTIDIETITDEDLKEKIDDYQEWYEKALDCKDAILELEEAQSELYETAFEHVATKYEGFLSVIEMEKTILEEFINQTEELGNIVSVNYYKGMIDNQKRLNKELEKERAALFEKRDEAVEAGAIKKYSEAWYEMCQEIDDVTKSIEEGNTALIEYANNIREVEWEVFDHLQERISNVSTEAEFLIDLMSNKVLHDKDTGQLTDEGMATMGMHAMNHNVNMYQANLYGEEIKKLDDLMAEYEKENRYDQELIDRRQELIELQQESILNAEDEKNAIKDLVEEGINLELDALDELIDKYLDAIETEKDLWDYQREIKKQTKEISDLEKQAIAYKGDDSEEAKQKVQELKVSLEEAKEDLQETEYEKYISDQEMLLDELYTEYEKILNERLDNIDALVQDMIDKVNEKSDAIYKTIGESAGKVGVKLSTTMKDIWSTENKNNVTNAIGQLYNCIGGKFGVKESLDKIRINVFNMVNQLNKLAGTKVEAARLYPAAKKEPDEKEDKKEDKKKEPEKPKVTDDDLWKIAAAIWCEPQAGWGNDPDRSTRLTARIGQENANKVQDIINKHSANGDLWNLWNDNGQDLSKYWYGRYASGAKNIGKTQMAWTQEGRKKEFIVRPSDGAILTPIAKGDSVLNAAATGNIWDIANNPSDFIKDNLDIGNINVPVNGSSNNTYIQNLDKVVFSMPNVQNYNEFVNALQRDKSFEKLIKSMTVDRLAGGSSLAKTKSIR